MGKATKLVEMLTSAAGPEGTFLTGSRHELPIELAEEWIACGAAREYVDPPEAAEDDAPENAGKGEPRTAEAPSPGNPAPKPEPETKTPPAKPKSAAKKAPGAKSRARAASAKP